MQTFEETSGYMRPERVNKWPNSMIDIWWWWWWWYIYIYRERDKERERAYTHTHTQTHTQGQFPDRRCFISQKSWFLIS